MNPYDSPEYEIWRSLNLDEPENEQTTEQDDRLLKELLAEIHLEEEKKEKVKRFSHLYNLRRLSRLHNN